jgi:hypothetical protein
MNLFHCFAVSHCTATECSLTGCVLEHNAVECMHYVGFLLVGAPHRGFMQQGPNLDYGLVGNMGYPKARKSYGYGGSIVGIMLCNSSRSLTSSGRMYLHTSSFVHIDLPKGSSFNHSKGSPLIIDKSGKVVTFAHLESSKLIHAIAHPDVLLLLYEPI